MNNIDELKKLTEELPPIPKLADIAGVKNVGQRSIQYKVDSGTSFGFSLLNRPEVAVQELFVSKGTSFPEHVHEEEMEWGILYKGKMTVIIDGEQIKLEAGDAIEFGKGKVHSSIALEDSWLIAVAIPQIDGYPE